VIAASGLHALERAGVRWCIRNAPERVVDLPPGSDIDVIVDGADLTRADAALLSAGFRRFDAPGHSGHRFYLARDGDRWCKLDVMVDAPVLSRRQRDGDLWVAAPADQDAHARARAAGRPALSGRARLARARPLSWRRTGPVVAVLGPDGAGKGTVIDGLVARLPVGVTVARLGTARSGPAPETDSQPPPSPRPVREVVFVTRKWLRSLRRLVAAYAAAWRGHIVLCDRHPVEVLAVHPHRSPVAARWERLVLTRGLPRPDAIVVLDAPTAVLVARKPEHPAATIERWRTGYRQLPGAVVVDTSADVDASVTAASRVVWDALATRRGWR